jgi:hypothetical protein
MNFAVEADQRMTEESVLIIVKLSVRKQCLSEEQGGCIIDGKDISQNEGNTLEVLN